MTIDKLDRNNIFERVSRNIRAILEIGRPDNSNCCEQLTKKTDVFKDLGIDSIEIMDLLGLLEKEFDITFDIEKFGQRRTVADIVEFIAAQLTVKQASPHDRK